MNWIKVEPNPADNDNHPERLPAMEKVVHIVYQNDDDIITTLGGRTDSGEGMGWLWAINDSRYGYTKDDKFNDLVADDEYLVTHWAEIEWPE